MLEEDLEEDKGYFDIKEARGNQRRKEKLQSYADREKDDVSVQLHIKIQFRDCKVRDAGIYRK